MTTLKLVAVRGERESFGWHVEYRGQRIGKVYRYGTWKAEPIGRPESTSEGHDSRDMAIGYLIGLNATKEKE